MPDPVILFWALIFGSIGLGYFIYGRRQSQPVIRYTGITLMLYPYLVTDVMAVVLVGLALLLLPFVMKRFF